MSREFSIRPTVRHNDESRRCAGISRTRQHVATRQFPALERRDDFDPPPGLAGDRLPRIRRVAMPPQILSTFRSIQFRKHPRSPSPPLSCASSYCAENVGEHSHPRQKYFTRDRATLSFRYARLVVSFRFATYIFKLLDNRNTVDSTKSLSVTNELKNYK